MTVHFWGYPPCTTCIKAVNYLTQKGYTIIYHNVKEETPSVEALRHYVQLSQKPLKAFFNTSGLLYRELNLKETLSNLSDDQQLDLLHQHGMLIKRPLMVFDQQQVLVGFKPEAIDAL